MVANHMLQLVALIAMEPPALYDGTAIRDEKAKVFRSMRKITPEQVPQCTVTGQYEEGAVGGKVVKGYDDELGYDSNVETFVAIKAHIDNWRWQGVPSTCAPASAWPSAAARSRSSSSRAALDVLGPRRRAAAQYAGDPPAAGNISSCW